MIMWEFTSGVTPFNERVFDFQLSLSICTGERPEIIENTPQCYFDLMRQCWNTNPKKRPKTSKVKNIIKNWYNDLLNYQADNNYIETIDEKSRNDVMEFLSADYVPTSYKSIN